MRRNHAASVVCQICGKPQKPREAMPGEMVRDCVVETIRQEHPDWSPDGYICLTDLDHYRARYVERILEQEKGELSELEQQVVQSLKEQELIFTNINTEFDREATFGERLSDQVAAFGGSWKFIIQIQMEMMDELIHRAQRGLP